MRIALAGNFDTFLFRGLERPRNLWPTRPAPGVNRLSGLRKLGVDDIPIVVATSEVSSPVVEHEPFGTVHRFQCPMFSVGASFCVRRRRPIHQDLAAIGTDIGHGRSRQQEHALAAVTPPLTQP